MCGKGLTRQDEPHGHLRWWAREVGEVGKPNVVQSNAEYGIGKRSHVSDGTKRRDPDMAKFENG